MVIVIHVLLFGCSRKKIELIIAAIKGVRLIMIKVFATLVFSIDTTKGFHSNLDDLNLK